MYDNGDNTMNKLWLVIKNKDTKIVWTKYFFTEREMDNYLRRIKYVKNLMLLEDSRDIVYN